jgi:hypothetical protein
MAETEPRKEKDLWDKLQIVFHPLNGLLTALTVALLGYYTSGLLRDNETRAANERVYTELMSSREQAESSLRRTCFFRSSRLSSNRILRDFRILRPGC